MIMMYRCILALLYVAASFSLVCGLTNQVYPTATNITLLGVYNTSVQLQWDEPIQEGNVSVIYFQIVIQNIHFMATPGVALKVNRSVHSITVNDLHPSVIYRLSVVTYFSSATHIGGNSKTSPLYFSLPNATLLTSDEICWCDQQESLNTTDSCQAGSRECTCREHSTGSMCQLCVGGYYRREGEVCEECPCSTDHSSGECEWDPASKSLRCLECKAGLTGDRCYRCTQGYYRGNNMFDVECLPCDCLYSPQFCMEDTGQCTHCPNGTAGRRCEVCASGFTGAAPNCTLTDSILVHMMTSLARNGPIVVGLSVGVLVVACIVAIFLGVRRCQTRRDRLTALWSALEMKAGIGFTRAPGDSETAAILNNEHTQPGEPNNPLILGRLQFHPSSQQPPFTTSVEPPATVAVPGVPPFRLLDDSASVYQPTTTYA